MGKDSFFFFFFVLFNLYYRDFSLKSKLITSLFQTVKLLLKISLFNKIFGKSLNYLLNTWLNLICFDINYIKYLHVITVLLTSLKAPTKG